MKISSINNYNQINSRQKTNSAAPTSYITHEMQKDTVSFKAAINLKKTKKIIGDFSLNKIDELSNKALKILDEDTKFIQNLLYKNEQRINEDTIIFDTNKKWYLIGHNDKLNELAFDNSKKYLKYSSKNAGMSILEEPNKIKLINNQTGKVSKIINFFSTDSKENKIMEMEIFENDGVTLNRKAWLTNDITEKKIYSQGKLKDGVEFGTMQRLIPSDGSYRFFTLKTEIQGKTVSMYKENISHKIFYAIKEFDKKLSDFADIMNKKSAKVSLYQKDGTLRFVKEYDKKEIQTSIKKYDDLGNIEPSKTQELVNC